MSTRRLLFFAGRSLFQLWAMLECFYQYRMMKRRVGLGLCDPLAANQVLLWGTVLTAGLLIYGFEYYLNHVRGIAILDSPPAAPSALRFNAPASTP